MHSFFDTKLCFLPITNEQIIGYFPARVKNPEHMLFAFVFSQFIHIAFHVCLQITDISDKTGYHSNFSRLE